MRFEWADLAVQANQLTLPVIEEIGMLEREIAQQIDGLGVR